MKTSAARAYPPAVVRTFGLCVLVTLALLCSCRTIPRIPTDQQNAAQKVNPSTAANHWGVLTWFVEEYEHHDKTTEDEMAAAREGVANAEGVLFKEWANTLDYPFLKVYEDAASKLVELRLDDAGLENARMGELSSARDALGPSIPVDPRVTYSFPWIKNLNQTDNRYRYSNWVRRTTHTLGNTAYEENRKNIRESLEKLLGDGLAETVDGLKKLVDADKFDKAEEKLHEIHTDLEGMDIKGIESKIKDQAANMIVGELTRMKDKQDYVTLDTNNTAIVGLEEKLAEWKKDIPFAREVMASMPEKVQEALYALRTDIGDQRGKCLQPELRSLAENEQFWEMHVFHKKTLDEASNLDEHIKKAFQEQLWDVYEELLPDAFDCFVKEGRRELNKERPGIAVLLCAMLRRMKDHLDGADDRDGGPSSGQVAKLESLDTESRREIRDHPLINRRFFIEMGDAGDTTKRFISGLEKRRGEGDPVDDLPTVLGRLNRELLYGVQLAEARDKRRSIDYRMYGVNCPQESADVTPFSYEEEVKLPGKKTTRTVSLKGKTRVIHEQQFYVYTITVKEEKWEASATVDFKIERDGKESRYEINLGDALRKTVVRKESAGEPTIMVEAVAADAPDGELLPKLDLPTPDKVSGYSMRTWALAEAKKLTIMKILHVLASYPLELAAEAKKYEGERNWPMAANHYGLLFEYMRNINLDTDKVPEAFASAKPAEHAQADSDRNRALLAALQELDARVWSAATDAVTAHRREILQ